MTTLANAPLIVVSTEFRWATVSPDGGDDSVDFVFSPVEEAHHPNLFLEIASSNGFSAATRVEGGDEGPFMASYRTGREDGTGPSYLIGLGSLEVQHPNEGYDWETYKSNVMRGFGMLQEYLSGAYETVPFIGSELAYVDGFFLKEGETPQQFLENKLAIDVRVSREFNDSRYFREKPSSVSFVTTYELAKPNGTLRISLEHGELSGRSAVLMVVRVLSVGRDRDYSAQGIADWLEAAHEVQRHTFNTLIKPAFKRQFQ